MVKLWQYWMIITTVITLCTEGFINKVSLFLYKGIYYFIYTYVQKYHMREISCWIDIKKHRNMLKSIMVESSSSIFRTIMIDTYLELEEMFWSCMISSLLVKSHILDPFTSFYYIQLYSNINYVKHIRIRKEIPQNLVTIKSHIFFLELIWLRAVAFCKMISMNFTYIVGIHVDFMHFHHKVLH